MPSWRVFLVSWVLLIPVLSVIARGGFYDSRRHQHRIPGGVLLTNYTTTLISVTTTPTSSTERTTVTSPSSTQPSSTPTSANEIPANSTTSVTSETSSTSPALPSPTESSSDLQTVYDRRVEAIISGLTGLSSIPTWLSTQQPNGQWPDVDYSAGCSARPANWPAQQHWLRINTLAGAFHGSSAFGRAATKYLKNQDVRGAITLAMNWWFSNDFTNINCLDNGGNAPCPCGTAGMWSTNWYSNIILIPQLVGNACLLLLQQPSPGDLTPTQYSNCTHFTFRSFNTFMYPVIGGVGTLTGSNTLDVASIGVSQGLLQGDENVLTMAYAHIHNEVQIQTPLKADGIRPDGSFGQHVGLLYDGNYGMVYMNDVLNLELEAAGTSWTAGSGSKDAVISYVDGFQWAIYRNVLTDVLHWDFSVVGRFISFPVADNQATGSIKTNLTQVQQLGKEWGSATMTKTATRLNQSTTNANAGRLTGNRMFWDNDYMVHRGSNYVTTLRMFSSRTHNTECLNAENPFGFHLSDGTLYTYLYGGEYEDIAAAWDWNLIPGTSTDYGNTPLSCATAAEYGVEDFVGGVSNGTIGVAAFRYTNPITKSFQFQKAWFFFDEVQHVLVSSVTSSSLAPIRNVLDQKVHDGTTLYVDEESISSSANYSSFTSLWHQNIGYVFQNSTPDDTLNVAVQMRTGNWGAIGISTQPNATVDMFTATIDKAPGADDLRVSYSIFPGIPYDDFQWRIHAPSAMGGPPVVLQNDANISGVLDRKNRVAGVVFWATGGGSIDIPFMEPYALILTLTIDQPSVVIVNLKENEIVVADPSQSLQNATVTLSWEDERPTEWKPQHTINIAFPQEDGIRGQSVTSSLF